MVTDTTRVGSSAVGVVRLEGADRLDLLNRLSTNELAPLAQPGRVVSTVLTTPKGRVVDWLWVLSRAHDLVLRTSPGRGERVRDWIAKFVIAEDVRANDESDAWRRLVLHGPRAVELAGVEPGGGRWLEANGALWHAGLGAYGPRLEALAPAPAEARVRALRDRGAERAGDAELELLRLRAGVPAAHREFEREINPLELRLGAHAVSFDKGCYVGQEVLARMHTYDKVARVLIGFECERSLPEEEELKLSCDGRHLGRVTSIANLAGGGAVGLGLVKRHAAAGDLAAVRAGEVDVPVRLCDRPFWRP